MEGKTLAQNVEIIYRELSLRVGGGDGHGKDQDERDERDEQVKKDERINSDGDGDDESSLSIGSIESSTSLSLSLSLSPSFIPLPLKSGLFPRSHVNANVNDQLVRPTQHSALGNLLSRSSAPPHAIHPHPPPPPPSSSIQDFTLMNGKQKPSSSRPSQGPFSMRGIQAVPSPAQEKSSSMGGIQAVPSPAQEKSPSMGGKQAVPSPAQEKSSSMGGKQAVPSSSSSSSSTPQETFLLRRKQAARKIRFVDEERRRDARGWVGVDAAVATSPRTTRRNMLRKELTDEDVVRSLRLEREARMMVRERMGKKGRRGENGENGGEEMEEMWSHLLEGLCEGYHTHGW